MSAIEVSKNILETIRFQVTEFKGKPYADIRVYYRDDNGEWKPTKTGLTISPEIWPEFLQGRVTWLDEEETKLARAMPIPLPTPVAVSLGLIWALPDWPSVMCTAIGAGNGKKVSAAYAGISETTLSRVRLLVCPTSLLRTNFGSISIS